MSQIKLLPLTPAFDRQQHQVYLDAINDALSQDKAIRNIALSGGYGVGKSSILSEVAKARSDKTIEISLSTLGLADGDGGGDDVDVSPTNRIQKEIVKQLLYREEPHKMPGSRFRRIAQMKLLRSAAAAGLIGFVLALVFLLSGWTAKLATSFHTSEWGPWFDLVVLGVLALTALASLALLHNRVAIKGLKVANAEIALSSDNTTYFDQFLDEIVYFFEVTDYDLVIFEDIDRFDDPHIFETLRALNTLLNASKQLHGRSIRFIYAVKDSIFDPSEPHSEPGRQSDVATKHGPVRDRVADEVARANRTKFFDVVIPVVPFITHRNGRDLITEVMQGTTPVLSDQLIDIAARHLPDMRLIKNVHNEFLIFKAKVLAGGVDLGIDQMFGMMLYKNTHLSDFERIREGRSQLDALYDDSRRLVRHNLAQLDKSTSLATRRLAHLDSAASRSPHLGEQFIKYVDAVRSQLSFLQQEWRVTFRGASFSQADLKDSPFWKAVAEAAESETISVYQLSTGYGQSVQLNLTKEELAAQVGDTLSSSDWNAAATASLQQTIASNQADRHFLRHASFRELYEEPRFVDINEQTFRDLAAIHLDSALAAHLVAAGFIDQNFALYTSTYYGTRVSARAQNFLLHNIERSVPDFDAVLDGDEVDSLLKECGDSVLREQGFYNVSVLDHLLGTGSARATILIDTLLTLGEQEQAFFDAYFASGQHVEDLVAHIAARWTRTLSFIFERHDLDDGRKVALLDVSLRNLGSEPVLGLGDDFREFVETHAAEFSSFNDDSTAAAQATQIANALDSAGVRIPALEGVAEAVRAAFVGATCYRVTRTNLVAATGSANLELDTLRAHDRTVYEFVLENLREYLDALDDGDPLTSTLRSSEGALAVIADLVSRHGNSDWVDEVLNRANLAADSIEMAGVPAPAWPVLADHLLFAATYKNVRRYIDEVGRIDEHLGRYLGEKCAITVDDDTIEPDRQVLATEILSASATIPSPEARVELVISLGLSSYIDLAAIPAESGPLLSLLIGRNEIADTAESYRLTMPHDWATKESAIVASTEFVNYMSPAEVPVDDVANLLRSDRIGKQIKDKILAEIDTFIPADDDEALRAAAHYAVATHRGLYGHLLRIAGSGVTPETFANLLALSVTGMNLDEIRPAAQAVGGWLGELVSRNGARPKIENTAANRAIIDRLEQLGEISSSQRKGDTIQVNLKRD